MSIVEEVLLLWWWLDTPVEQKRCRMSFRIGPRFKLFRISDHVKTSLRKAPVPTLLLGYDPELVDDARGDENVRANSTLSGVSGAVDLVEIVKALTWTRSVDRCLLKLTHESSRATVMPRGIDYGSFSDELPVVYNFSKPFNCDFESSEPTTHVDRADHPKQRGMNS